LKSKCIAIVGPTASGKTAASIILAKELNAEIISADSRQIYKHIPVASAIPSIEERQGIKHYFLEELELDEEFNAGEFGKRGRKIINDIFSRGIIPVIVGGSGLYIKSLIDGFFDEEIKDEEIRKKLYNDFEKYGKEYLYNKLLEIDPESAIKMTPNYFRRIIRALEVFYVSGKKISELHKEKPEIEFETIQIGLQQDRKLLYERINNRVDEMLSNGLIEEVKWLKDNGYHYSTHNSLNTVGIKEVFKYFEDEYTYDKMLEMIKQNTRRYAKRQLTWFRKDKRINWMNKFDLNEILNLLK
jgi:tRNA dimethylallyltransferase